MIDFDRMDWLADLTNKAGDILIFLLIAAAVALLSVWLVWAILEHVL